MLRLKLFNNINKSIRHNYIQYVQFSNVDNGLNSVTNKVNNNLKITSKNDKDIINTITKNEININFSDKILSKRIYIKITLKDNVKILDYIQLAKETNRYEFKHELDILNKEPFEIRNIITLNSLLFHLRSFRMFLVMYINIKAAIVKCLSLQPLIPIDRLYQLCCCLLVFHGQHEDELKIIDLLTKNLKQYSIIIFDKYIRLEYLCFGISNLHPSEELDRYLDILCNIIRISKYKVSTIHQIDSIIISYRKLSGNTISQKKYLSLITDIINESLINHLESSTRDELISPLQGLMNLSTVSNERNEFLNAMFYYCSQYISHHKIDGDFIYYAISGLRYFSGISLQEKSIIKLLAETINENRDSIVLFPSQIINIFKYISEIKVNDVKTELIESLTEIINKTNETGLINERYNNYIENSKNHSNNSLEDDNYIDKKVNKFKSTDIISSIHPLRFLRDMKCKSDSEQSLVKFYFNKFKPQSMNYNSIALSIFYIKNIQLNMNINESVFNYINQLMELSKDNNINEFSFHYFSICSKSLLNLINSASTLNLNNDVFVNYISNICKYHLYIYPSTVTINNDLEFRNTVELYHRLLHIYKLNKVYEVISQLNNKIIDSFDSFTVTQLHSLLFLLRFRELCINKELLITLSKLINKHITIEMFTVNTLIDCCNNLGRVSTETKESLILIDIFTNYINEMVDKIDIKNEIGNIKLSDITRLLFAIRYYYNNSNSENNYIKSVKNLALLLYDNVKRNNMITTFLQSSDVKENSKNSNFIRLCKCLAFYNTSFSEDISELFQLVNELLEKTDYEVKEETFISFRFILLTCKHLNFIDAQLVNSLITIINRSGKFISNDDVYNQLVNDFKDELPIEYVEKLIKALDSKVIR